ncbi:DEAD/DEAH box helicase [Amphritea balenae]|uniref:DEAD/DEAH box helicase n=1 Tax=Amphritea balenae TaxID=452629 RepID=A0A3P1SKL7_9GAMM|nr:DEAD/DEAH box helicase [Amphritea balenae]RRC97823.1 DEAD/DEAH box helicase [Amphritea balenae]GGK83277.1 DEAD/DEAH box helicase [Amphritea balenae]
MQFSETGINAALISAVTEKGYQVATPIQEQAIPVILQGKDLMAGARTGTGKTAAFALPLLQRITEAKFKAERSQQERDVSVIRGLVLIPTRELARQVHRSFIAYGCHTQLRSVLVYGGASIDEQILQLEQGADIVIATPGRLLDLLFKQKLDLSAVETLVLDEADRMLDMGFSEDIAKILKQLPIEHQSLLFSATFDNQIFKFSKQLLNKPALIEVDKRNSAAIDVLQRIYTIDPDRKAAATEYLLKTQAWQQVLIFCRTKQQVDKLTQTLTEAGISSAAVHGDKSQKHRNTVLEQFREGQLQALVATDLAARGLDIEQLSVVLNYALPFNSEDYIHRIGRTGRAGNSGEAISLVSPEESELLDAIQERLDSQLLQQWLTGFEPDMNRKLNRARKGSKGSQKKKALARALAKSKQR